MNLITTTKQILVRFFADRFYDQSAQMAYYLMLSLFPFLIFLFSLISFLQIDPDNILVMIEPFAPHDTYIVVRNTLESILDKGRGELLSFSLIAAFWLASMAIQSLVRSLNKAYDIKRKQSFFLQGVISDLLLTLGFMIIFSFSLLVPIIEDFIRTYVLTRVTVDELWYRLWFLTRWGLGTLFLYLFFSILYKVVPSIRVPWRGVFPGALFATIGWQVVSIVFSRFAGIGNYAEFYGQLGSIIALMVWFYLTAVVLLIGGMINASLYKKQP
ncbi:YihY/virulence factor BrkB family protein [Lentibacillus sp. Marseille-P4043]|uniref:YihY/virulence factor BrkB family protein n=1 Tax=Lentibacillus sp. Marseille-P4043 TaxID=2040293 RepID=UPI000D0ACD95|nr:YihY/virulence factor BrkB family protein [Lentibacillus sp. Marseille-P4043]